MPAVPPEQLAAFLAEPVPRRQVSDFIRRTVQARENGVWGLGCGGFFVLAGLLGMWVFFPWSFRTEQRLKTEGLTAPGHITSGKRANMKIYKRSVWGYTFTFNPGGGTAVTGECYTTGQLWKDGARVVVRYLPKDAATCCPEGARLTKGGRKGLIFGLFPGIGLLLIGYSIWRGRRLDRLLVGGQVVEAVVLALEERRYRSKKGGTSIIYHAALRDTTGREFNTDSQVVETIALLRERLETKQPVFVLHDPASPRLFLLPESW